MKYQQPEKSSTLLAQLTLKSGPGHLSQTLPENKTKVEAPTDFWQAIRTIIGLQNQAPPLQPVPRNQNLPLSFPQERLWFLDQLAPGSSSYNVPMAFRLVGPLNLSALEQSLNEIVQRHEALRTTFTTVDGQPVQVIAPTLTLTVSVVDLRELPETERDQTMQLITEEAQRSFNLSLGPLLRAALLQLSEDEHVLILTVHHIVFDGWSAYSVLFKELAVLYEAFSTGKPNTLPELPIQYVDFAVWQRQWLQGEFLETLLSYWKQQLGSDFVQHLPTDRLRPTALTCRSAYQTLVISESLTQALKVLSRQQSVTLFTTLLAAFKVLLHRYTNQDELFVCTPTANRNRTETKGLIGYFVNLLVLHTDLSGNPSFRELLHRMTKVISGSYAHQDLPVQRLIDCLNLIHIPLSQVMFAFQNVPMQPLQLSGLTVSSLQVDNGTADFDLFLSMQEEAETLTGVLKYNSDLFDDSTITQMLNQFQLLLESVVDNPEQPLSSLLSGKIDRSKSLTSEQSRLKLERAYRRDSREYVAPRNNLEFQLTKIWEVVLGIQPIGVTDNFFELGAQSLQALLLFTQIEKMFGKNLPLATLFQAPTIEQHAKILQQEEWVAPWDSLVAIKTDGDKLPLFCVHPLDGNILVFQSLARHLDPNQPVYGLQAKGLDGKQAPHTRFEDMATDYIKEIRSVQPNGPYFLAGYSSGGVVAFEMAQQLQAQGQQVALVALFDTYCPVYNKSLSFKSWLSRHVSNLLQLNSKEKLRYFTGGLKKMQQKLQAKIVRKYPDADKKSSPTPTRKDDNQAAIYIDDLFIAQKQAVGDAARAYVPQIYPGRVVLFRSAEQPWWLANDPELGWGGLAASGLEIHEIPGDHLSIMRTNVVVLAEQLRAYLDNEK